MEAINVFMDWMALDEAEDPTGTDEESVAVGKALKERRKSAIAEARHQAEEFLNGARAAMLAAAEVFVARGRYIADIDRLLQSFFQVEPRLDTNGQVVDVVIKVSSNLSIAQDPAKTEKQALYVALLNARTVIRTVVARLEEGKLENAKGQRLREEYMSRLVTIGRQGLQDGHVELANLNLNGFREDFVAQEAGMIKNRYLRSLGWATGIAAILCVLVYLSVEYFTTEGSVWHAVKIFLIGGVGAAIGTWLSFSIRRVTLSFDDLGVIEEDRLDPGVRVMFVFALTIVVFLLFWTGAINLEIGDLKTGELSKPGSTLPIVAIALLIGVLCGISERALATTISGRAAAFVRSVGS